MGEVQIDSVKDKYYKDNNIFKIDDNVFFYMLKIFENKITATNNSNNNTNKLRNCK